MRVLEVHEMLCASIGNLASVRLLSLLVEGLYADADGEPSQRVLPSGLFGLEMCRPVDCVLEGP
jgi:hypothetical protein